MRNQTQEEFMRQFCGAVGVIEGGDGMPIQITSLSYSENCVADRNRSFGCGADEQALLVEWIPMGMTFTKAEPGKFPKEAGVDASKVPPRETWVTFPKSFNGLPVYYKRGQMAFLL